MKTRKSRFLSLIGSAIVAGSIVNGANAQVITTNFDFDPDGAGPIATIPNVATFDWGPDSALSDGGNAAIENFFGGGPAAGNLFNLYTHGVLSIIRNQTNMDVTPNSLNGPPPNEFEITFVAGFQEQVVAASGLHGVPGNQATFRSTGAIGPGIPNFFEIYYDATPDAMPLAGTGYNDGTRIIAGTINADIASTLFTIIGDDADTPLDGFGADDYPAHDSITGFGATQLEATITFQDNNFIVNGDLLLMSIVNTFNNLNFTQVDPSAAFVKAAGGAAPVPDGAGVLPALSLGAVNAGLPGLSGPDVQFQTDATNSFTVLQQEVPEPATAAMALLGLGGLMMGSRRRRA